MAQPQLAAKTPVACAACFGQYPKRLHVDFRAAIDGPQVGDGPRAPHVSWVVICENCLRAGVSLLPEEQAAKEAAEQRIAALEDQLHNTQAFADKLEDALQSRPAPAPRTKPKAKPAQRRNRYEPLEPVEA